MWDPSRIAVVPDPDNPGHFKCQFLLKVGDEAFNTRHNPPVLMNHRSELTYSSLVPDGAERWYAWEQYFPADFSVTDDHTPSGGVVIMQMHHIRPSDGNEGGSPRLLLSAYTDSLELGGAPSLNSTGEWVPMKIPLIKGRWFPIVAHYIFSSDPSVGLAEIWVDGKSELSINTMTEFPGYEQYLKMGLYARPTAVPDIHSEIRNVIEASAQADVTAFLRPTASEPVDAGQPVDAGAPPDGVDAGSQTPSSSIPSPSTISSPSQSPSESTPGSGNSLSSSSELAPKSVPNHGCSAVGDAGLVAALLAGILIRRKCRGSSA